VASCGGGLQPLPREAGTPPARHYDLAARSSLYPSRCRPKRKPRAG